MVGPVPTLALMPFQCLCGPVPGMHRIGRVRGQRDTVVGQACRGPPRRRLARISNIGGGVTNGLTSFLSPSFIAALCV
jgi:hypothetical protein